MQHLHDLEYNGESWDLRMPKKNQSWTVVKYCKLILFRVMVVLVVKRLTCLPVREIRSDQGDPLEEETTHSSILAWKIPGTEEPGGLQFTGLQRVRHDWASSGVRIYSQGAEWESADKKFLRRSIRGKGSSGWANLIARIVAEDKSGWSDHLREGEGWRA